MKPLKLLNNANDRQIAYFELSILAVVWGSSFILIKRGLFAPNGEVIFSGLQLGALRMLISGLVLLPFVVGSLRKYSVRKLGLLLLVGLVGNGFPAILFAVAQTQIASSTAGILNATVPIFALLLGSLFFKTPLTTGNAVGVVVGFLGVSILVLTDASGALDFNAYTLLVLAATLCYGISLNLIKTYLKDIPSLVITGLAFSLMIIPLGCVLFFTGILELEASNPHFWRGFRYVALLAVVGTSLAVWLFNDLVKRTSALVASSVTYLIPIIAVLWGVWDGETFGLSDILGSLVVLLGVYLINKNKK